MDNFQFDLYRFTEKTFTYNNVFYRVVITPELMKETDYELEDADMGEAADLNTGLDFTGSYIGILISSEQGTIPFVLEPDIHTRWETDIKGWDPGIIDELDKIISEIRSN